VNYTHFTASRFDELCQAAGFSQEALDPDSAFRELANRYSEPQRHYHNASHIDECLAEFNTARTSGKNPVALEFAIWFHDAIYEPRRPDNEEQSAALAVEFLRPNAVLAECVYSLVLTTKTHVPQDRPDAALLIDLDLSILGKQTDRFAEYEARIRAEYSWVPLPLYSEKRAMILRDFLARPRIFNTDLFYDRYEAQARRNLAGSIALLEAQRTPE
jgi:predicted metal-dependent HD superfamily phosphohydrolase